MFVHIVVSYLLVASYLSSSLILVASAEHHSYVGNEEEINGTIYDIKQALFEQRRMEAQVHGDYECVEDCHEDDECIPVLLLLVLVRYVVILLRVFVVAAFKRVAPQLALGFGIDGSSYLTHV